MTTNLTAWAPTPGQREFRDVANMQRTRALQAIATAHSIEAGKKAQDDMRRSQRKLDAFAAIQASTFPGAMLRLSHGTLDLLGSASQCPCCMREGAARWVQDDQSLECDDARAVLRCSACRGRWSVPSAWVDDNACDACDRIGEVETLNGDSLCAQCARNH